MTPTFASGDRVRPIEAGDHVYVANATLSNGRRIRNRRARVIAIDGDVATVQLWSNNATIQVGYKCLEHAPPPKRAPGAGSPNRFWSVAVGATVTAQVRRRNGALVGETVKYTVKETSENGSIITLQTTSGGILELRRID